MADIFDYIISNDIIGPSAVQNTCTEWDLMLTDVRATRESMFKALNEIISATDPACNSPAPQESDCWENYYITTVLPLYKDLYIELQHAEDLLFNSLSCGPTKTGIVTESYFSLNVDGVAVDTLPNGTWYRTFPQVDFVDVDVDYGAGNFLPEYWDRYKAACEAYACGTKAFFQSFMGDGFGEADIEDPSVPIFP